MEMGEARVDRSHVRSMDASWLGLVGGLKGLTARRGSQAPANRGLGISGNPSGESVL